MPSLDRFLARFFRSKDGIFYLCYRIKSYTCCCITYLTFIKRGLGFLILQVNTPIVSEKRALPMEALRGIITLTLVVSRSPVSKGPIVKRGAFVMFNFFRIKNQIDLDIEEYLKWKARYSLYTSENHKRVLNDFVKCFKYKTISEITLTHIQDFYTKCKERTGSEYSSICIMEALRGFLSYYKRQHNINPRQVSNRGVIDLQFVEDNAMVPVMKHIKRGRPLSVALIEQVQRLRNNEKLSFRAIGKAMGKDVSQVYVWYKVDLKKKLLTNA